MSRIVSFSWQTSSVAINPSAIAPTLVITDGPHRLIGTTPVAVEPSIIVGATQGVPSEVQSPFKLSDWGRLRTT